MERAPHGATVTHVALFTFSTAMLLALFSFYLLDYILFSRIQSAAIGKNKIKN